MPTHKKPRKPKTEERTLQVALTEKERIDLGLTLLGIKDGARRQATLAEFEPMLSRCASVLANIGSVQLPSDHKAATRPLVRAAQRFEDILRSGDREVFKLMRYFNFVNDRALFDQLAGMQRYWAWLNSHPSKRGGERRSYAKHERESQSRIFENWFHHRHERSDPDGVATAKKAFAKKAAEVIKRTLREAVAHPSNTGKK